MALDRVEIRCTDNEKAAWELAASRTPFKKLGTWLKWLANTAAETPVEMKVTIAGVPGQTSGTGPSPIPGFSAPLARKGYEVAVERDWETTLPVVTVNGEEIPWLDDQTGATFRLPPYEYPSGVITEIRKKLRELN